MLTELTIAFICCGLCALPLYIIAFFGEHDTKPINFWAGDKSLEIADVEGYNSSMAALYKRCALILIVTPVLIILHVYIFIGVLCFECTVGIYIVYRQYKKILNRYRSGS